MDKGKLLFLGQLPLCFGVWVKGGTIRKGMENDKGKKGGVLFGKRKSRRVFLGVRHGGKDPSAGVRGKIWHTGRGKANNTVL